ncbi:LysR substrate binding domain-containing protein [Pseudogulbenkiania subflava DSM 22618]|uniref:LysR substrate binding domain-containing protein n=2 Tax=Pseudogulbenkiania subflava TaxID=451637 RepID=A0A1Y6BZF8_9NEIS|nr:LysR substrate binding domain-containing protein [Pseudogulbenkiania subflava DSM 22618]
MSGQGVALGWLPLVQDLLAGGQLVSLADAPVTTPRGYFLVLRESTRLTGVIGRFRRWAREVCANAPQEQGGAGGTSAIG